MKFAEIPVLLFVFTLVFLSFISCQKPSPENTYKQVIQFENSWQLNKAEQLAQDLPVDEHPEYAAVLSRILLKQGELKKTEQFLSGLSRPMVHSNENLIYHLSRTYYYRGKLAKSRTFAQQLLQMGRKQDDSLQLARAEYVLGRIAFNRAEYAKAREHQYRSLTYAQAAGSIQAEANALRQIGVITWYNMNFRTALERYFFPALEKYRNVNNKMGEATTLANIGLVYNDQNKLQESAGYNLRAFDIRRKIGDKLGLADSYYFLSNTLAISGWANTFRYSLRKKSLELSLDIGYEWGAEVAARSMVVLTRHKKIPLSTHFSQQLDSLAFESAVGRVYKKQYNANLAWKSGHLKKSAILFEELLQIHIDDNNTNALAFTYANAGSVHYKLEEFQKAEKYFSNAQALLDQSDAPVRYWYNKFYLANIKAQNNRHTEAQKDLEDILQHVDSVYAKGVKSLTNHIYIDHSVNKMAHLRKKIYTALVEISLESDNLSPFEYIERSKRSITHPDIFPSEILYSQTNADNAYNQFVNTFKNYEQRPDQYNHIQPLVENLTALLQEYLNRISTLQEFANSSKPQEVTGVPDLQSLLGDNEAFIHFFVGQEQVLAHLTKADTSSVIQLPLSRTDLVSVTNVYNGTMRRGKEDPGDDLWQAPASYLYQRLIHPLEKNELIETGHHLFISPHHILRQIPFQALLDTDMKESKFAVEKFDISYVPSATYLTTQREHKSNPAQSVFAVAPDVHSLPFTRKEIEEIPFQHFKQYKKLTGASASSNQIYGSLNGYDIFHYAGHISSNSWFPLSSKIELADRPVNLFELLDDQFNFKLAILSACESGEMSDYNFDAFNGFSNAFLRKGTENVISSQWLVDDKSTSRIMHHFYKQLKENNYFESQSQSDVYPPVPYFAKALSDAQRRYIKDSHQNKNSTHPFYWAAFRLTGSGN